MIKLTIREKSKSIRGALKHMKITEVNTYYVRPRWGFVEIVTDEGYTGWGEAVLEGHCDAVLACVNEYKPYLIGKDPMRIEDIQATIYRAGFYRGGGVLMSAISGIDQCLWDIKGKFFGAPVWQLMGGACRDRMKVYSWIGGDRPSDVGSAAKERQDNGFTAIKMNATDELQMIDTYDKIDAVLERVASIREACGKYFGIAIDFHGRVHKPMAKILAKKLEEFDPMFIEEPVLCENMEEFKEIRRVANIPIATGERLFTKYDFKRLLQTGGVDIIQPDLSHAGGITEVKKIASMAEAYDVALAPHCPLGPIALAACLNVDATCYNAVIQEQSIGIHYNVGKEVLDYALNKEDFKFTDGYVDLPKKPGLGVEVNKELVLEENANPHQWKNPVWRHKDGSVAEW
jgi:galactonate dehydratase